MVKLDPGSRVYRRVFWSMHGNVAQVTTAADLRTPVNNPTTDRAHPFVTPVGKTRQLISIGIVNPHTAASAIRGDTFESVEEGVARILMHRLMNRSVNAGDNTSWPDAGGGNLNGQNDVWLPPVTEVRLTIGAAVGALDSHGVFEYYEYDGDIREGFIESAREASVGA